MYSLDPTQLTVYFPRHAEDQIREESDAPGAHAHHPQPRPTLVAAHRAEARARRRHRRRCRRGVRPRRQRPRSRRAQRTHPQKQRRAAEVPPRGAREKAEGKSFGIGYIAASSAPQFSQYHSVARFIVPHWRHLSVFSTGASSSTGAWGVASCGSSLCYCPPLARRGDGAFLSSSVTDLRNASSSNGVLRFSGVWGAGDGVSVSSSATLREGGGAGGAGFAFTSASSSTSRVMSRSIPISSSRTAPRSASASLCTCAHCASSYSPTS